MGTYAIVLEVRGEPEVPDVAPPSDADLEARIRQAEDWIDSKLSHLPIDATTGRRVVEAGVDATTWAQIKRAAIRLAARLHDNPRILQPPAFAEISGPDFSRKAPAPVATRIPDVIGPLNASGLRSTGGRAVA